MTVQLYPDFFNDVFGPIMQPGSSSHTAAPCRLGFMANCLLGERPAQVQVLLDVDSSFAGTFGLMAEDSAMLAGAMGLMPDDKRLYNARTMAQELGISHAFGFTEMKESTHINAVKFVLTGKGGKVATLVGDSTGGGMIETKVVNGYPLRVRGDTYVVLLFDPQATVAPAQVDRLASGFPALVEVGSSATPSKGTLHYLKVADPPDLGAVRAMFPDHQVELLAPVLAVVTRPGHKPQLFDTMTRWREIAEEQGVPLWEVAVSYEMHASGWPREEVIAYMRMIERKMYRQTHAVYEETLDVPVSPFRPNMALGWAGHMRSACRLTDDTTANVIRWAYGAGAGIPGVETVAGPMGSGGGYVHAGLWAVKEAKGFSDDDLLRGLFVAGGVGVIAFTRTEPTGERIGCSGECGICGAMTAAAIAEMAGGTPEQVENAGSLSLQSAVGIPCDPIPGGLGQPCRSRIITATCMAPIFADLALSGRQAVLPMHEAIDVANDVGRRLPSELLCTSLGGSAAAPTARKQAAAYRAWYEQTEKDCTMRPPGNLI